MSLARALCLLLVATACPLIAAETFKLGTWASSEPNPVQYNGTGFEPLLAKELAKTAGFEYEVVTLATLPERFSALNESLVDFVIGAISVTPERAEIVDFVLPYYYSAGAGLFAPDGVIDGVSNWTDLAGKTIAAYDGYYGIPDIESYGITVVVVDDGQTAADKIAAGEAVAFVSDNTNDFSNVGLDPVASVPVILPLPYGIAVAKGNTELATKLGDALMKLVEGGDSAPILAIEKETFGAEGYPPNKDLADLVANPAGPNLLNPGS